MPAAGSVDRTFVTQILVHIGYHKTGTNWLQDEFFGDPATGYRWLDKRPVTHPVNRLIRARPLDFDAPGLRAEFEPLITEAAGLGLLPVLSFGRLSGHPYSGGYDTKEIADRLKQVFPEARILIVIREQRSMILSTYKQYVRAGGASTLEQFLLPARKHGWRVPGFHFGHFEYDRPIRYYQSLYGREAVLTLPYEQFVADGRGFVEAIARFAGRPVPGDVLDRMPFSRRSNEATSALAIAASRPLNRFGPRTDLNQAPLPWAKRLFRLAKRLQSSSIQAPGARTLAARSEARLRRVVEDVVGERYVASNRLTAELTGLDLAAYGWMV
jgi:sulfotransferase family protein